MEVKAASTRRRLLIFTGYFVACVGLIVLVIGIVEYSAKSKCPKTNPVKREQMGGLAGFIKKVKQTYYRLHPYRIVQDRDLDANKFIDIFSPYDPSPSAIKVRTDTAIKLRAELDILKLDKLKMTPRERKALSQLVHMLDNNFGFPFDENYYAGDWMMGPNYFCWQPICDLAAAIKAHFNPGKFQPKSATDVTKIINIIKKHKDSISQYQKNMMYGVKAGMVRAVEDCTAGRNAFKTDYPKIVEQGESGVLKESFVSHLTSVSYYGKVPDNEKFLWQKQKGKTMINSVKDSLVENIGASIAAFIEFLDHKYSRHCVPSSVSSGLALLPLGYVWYDQKENKSEPTAKVLPTGEILNGQKTYESILPYFTTSKKYTPAMIYELGMERLSVLMTRAEELAKQITGQDNLTAAVTQFKSKLNNADMFFNTTVIPEAENGEVGAKRCYNMASAEKNCPVRFEAMQEWFKFVQAVLAKIEPKTIGMFYMTGEKMTTPNCPVKMVAHFNPSSGSQSYHPGGLTCDKPGEYWLPFFMERPGPIYNSYSVAGHEVRPGHHTQIQGFIEHFALSDASDVIDWLNSVNYYTAFVEGWALYSEYSLLAMETNLYEGNPLQEYGMIKWQIWRALRLIIDTGLHHRRMTMQESIDLFEKYAWDKTDKSYKDTIRYMSNPGQATAYMIGQLAIWKMRNKTEEQLKLFNSTFSEKEFHFQILSQGSSPLEYLQEHIDIYIACKIDKSSRADCQEILHPGSGEKNATTGDKTYQWKPGEISYRPSFD